MGVAGGLIQTASGSGSGFGVPCTKRSGCRVPGGLQCPSALSQHIRCPVMMDIVGGEHRDPGMAVLGVVPGEERPAEGDGSGDVFEAAGEAGVVFQGLELRFGEGVVVADPGGGSSERVTPRSARSWAVHLLVIGAPRSECRVSTWGSMSCLRQVSSISVAASAAFSRSATIQPTT